MNTKIETFDDSMDDEALDRSTDLAGSLMCAGGHTAGTLGTVIER